MNIQLKKNQPPGEAIYTGKHVMKTEISHVYYDTKTLKTDREETLVPEMKNWFVFKGLSDSARIKSFCETAGVDPLVVEDVLNVHQRNKIEYFEKYVFAVFSYAYLRDGDILHDYLSVIVFADKVFTFHEHNVNLFEEVYRRLDQNKGPIRSKGHDYLFYAILDTILDNDIIVEKQLSEDTMKLEEDIIRFESTDQSILYTSRKELLYLKKTIDPILDSFMKAEYKPSTLVGNDMNRYFGDITDHLRRLSEEINSERELLRNLLDVHINNVSNRMNSVMKTLTIFSAIFIPLSFLAGVFGMNFVQFSILQNPYGIWIFIGLCLLISFGMILFFKLRKWF